MIHVDAVDSWTQTESDKTAHEKFSQNVASQDVQPEVQPELPQEAMSEDDAVEKDVEETALHVLPETESDVAKNISPDYVPSST